MWALPADCDGHRLGCTCGWRNKGCTRILLPKCDFFDSSDGRCTHFQPRRAFEESWRAGEAYRGSVNQSQALGNCQEVSSISGLSDATLSYGHRKSDSTYFSVDVILWGEICGLLCADKNCLVSTSNIGWKSRL